MELLVTNKDDYELLKQFASYSSDITGVIEIENKKVNEVLEKYKDIVSKYTDNLDNVAIVDDRPLLFLQNNKLFISNIDDALSLYLDLPYNKEVKQSSFDKVIEMLANNMITLDESALHIFKKLNETDNISELYCSKYNTNYKHKRWSLTSLGENATIADLKFSEREIETKTYSVYRNIKIEKIVDNTIYGKNDFLEFELRFYFLSIGQKMSLTPGTVINVMTDKPYGSKTKKILMGPEVVPNSFPNTFIRKTLKTNKRDIPVKLLRSAFVEYSYRNR